MEKDRILCVDDDLTLLNSLELILTSSGFDVSLTKSGNQAIRLLERGVHCDLILLDVDMPEMDGYETFRRIQLLPGCENIPIIFLTGMDAPDFEIRGLEIGAADYVVKPFVAQVLIARIKGHLRKVTKEREKATLNQQTIDLFTERLNDSEQIIARHIADGLTNQEIAELTHYSYNYVKKMSSSILSKLELTKRSEIRKLLNQ